MTQLIPAVNSKDHIEGSPEAVLELVEYGDYECPYCGRAYPIVKNIQRELGSGLRFVFRNFPLPRIHPHAYSAAVAAEAADLQFKFWKMHDIIFENQKRLDAASIFQYADSIGLNLERFKTDIQREELLDKVKQDFESGLRSGVNGTPSFFINGVKYNGSWEENIFLPFLKEQLAEAVNS